MVPPLEQVSDYRRYTRVWHDGLVLEIAHYILKCLARVLRLFRKPETQIETPHLQQQARQSKRAEPVANIYGADASDHVLQH